MFLLIRDPKKLSNSDHHSKKFSKKKREKVQSLREGNLESKVSSTADPFTTHEITEKARPEEDANTSTTTEFTTTEKQWKVYELYQRDFIFFTNYKYIYVLNIKSSVQTIFIVAKVRFNTSMNLLRGILTTRKPIWLSPIKNWTVSE